MDLHPKAYRNLSEVQRQATIGFLTPSTMGAFSMAGHLQALPFLVVFTRRGTSVLSEVLKNQHMVPGMSPSHGSRERERDRERSTKDVRET